MNAKTEEYRRIRGVVLKLLAMNNFGTMDSMVLRLKVRGLGFDIPENEFDGIEAYLEDKKYIHRETRHSGSIEIRMVRVTALGLDVLDGDPKDPGVDVRF